MTITATPEPGTEFTPPRIRLDLDAGSGETFVEVTVTRDGRPLPRTILPDGIGETYAYDYEAPFGGPVTYRATGTVTSGAYDKTVSVQFDEPGVWLIHPITPALSVRIGAGGVARVHSGTKDTANHTIPMSILEPPGRTEAVTYPMGPRKKPRWNLVLDCPDLAARDKIAALLSDGAPLLLRVPLDRLNAWDLTDHWYAVVDASEQRFEMSPLRRLALQMIPSAEPPVRLAPAFTWGELVARGMTWGDLLPRTWLDVLTGEV